MFDKLLVANRGEIARRILRTAKSLGYRTVAVYSEADASSPHVRDAHEAICIGPADAASSYLNTEHLLDAIKKTGAQAVHPGYGFLSESADFARALKEAGIVFVGPSSQAIEAMGSKTEAKRRMIQAGVPCVPGYHGAAQDLDTFTAQAEQVGYPLMVKASAGGGGRGMRLVQSAGELAAALESARSEAESAFGHGELLLERAIERARHVEIQIFADSHGNALHLGERDCSIQRRHQKVIEEAPSPALSQETRAAMGAAAVAAAQAIGYEGAGTVEFLLAEDGAFYFLEMNTRLQVEHPVTEMITGQDLVAWQLMVASGEPLPLRQAEVSFSGHAIEARLYAEDPSRGFLPQTGRAHLWRAPRGEGVRVDHGLRTGLEITPFYDPMLAKIIAHGPTRDVARRRLMRALEETALLGVPTNRAFLLACMEDECFRAGEATTAFIPQVFAQGFERAQATTLTLALAATLLVRARSPRQREGQRWSSTGSAQSLLRLSVGSDEVEVRLTLMNSQAYVVEVRGCVHTVRVLSARPGARYRVEVDGVQRTVHALWEDEALFLSEGRSDWVVEDVLRRPVRIEPGSDGRILAPMTGKMLVVDVSAGERVEAGQRLGVLEAMKMEHNVITPVAGQVSTLGCEQGEQVASKTLLFEIKPG